MAQGWLIAAAADIAAAHEISFGFDLDVLDPAAFAHPDQACETVAAADNIGVLLSTAAAQDAGFVTTLQALATRLARAQLILVDDDARGAFPFLPDWPAMSFADAQQRARIGAERRGVAPPTAPPEPPRQEHAEESAPPTTVTEAAPAEEPPPVLVEETPPADATPEPRAMDEPEPDAPIDHDTLGGAEESKQLEDDRETAAPPPASASAPVEKPARYRDMDEAPPAPPQAQPAPAPAAPGAFAPHGPEVPPAAAKVEAPSQDSFSMSRSMSGMDSKTMTGGTFAAGNAAAMSGLSAPADATAFAPKKLRRETPELVRVVIHQPRDLKAVIKAARKIDARAEPAPQSMGIGDVALGASIGVALEVRGASCADTDMQRRTWTGEPIDFSFVVEADDNTKQAVLIARVFINDAQIGMIAFTRNISGPKKKPADVGDGARMHRFKRVFLSYSAHDRDIVSAIATAYDMAGVQHFWDRTSLKSGEEWSPRLRKEIDKSDLFHLCWSKSAAASEWVEKEAEHALTRRKRSNGKTPSITVQMLDGPPWAPHPAALDSINFDDFVRAAIVGYARGEG